MSTKILHASQALHTICLRQHLNSLPYTSKSLNVPDGTAKSRAIEKGTAIWCLELQGVGVLELNRRIKLVERYGGLSYFHFKTDFA